MGMTAGLLRISNDELEEYLKNSSLLENRIYNDDDSENEDSNFIDVDKSWDGIIYLLTGQNATNANHPLVSIFFSGQFIDETQDLGYGPAHYLTPKQVKEIHKAISEISIDGLSKKFNPKEMDKIGVYPDIWTRDDDDTLEYLVSYFNDIVDFYSNAAKNNQAVISFLS